MDCSYQVVLPCAGWVPWVGPDALELGRDTQGMGSQIALRLSIMTLECNEAVGREGINETDGLGDFHGARSLISRVQCLS